MLGAPDKGSRRVRWTTRGKELSEAIHKKVQGAKRVPRQRPIAIHGIAETTDSKAFWSNFLKVWIRNDLGNWYTCILYPCKEPTNNLSEQFIRKHVLMRKIMGTFRLEIGAEYYQYIASVFATRRLQEKGVYDELKKLLVNELCLKWAIQIQ